MTGHWASLADGNVKGLSVWVCPIAVSDLICAEFTQFLVTYSISEVTLWFLGSFAKLLKAAVSFVMSVCLSSWNNSSYTGRIFMEKGVWKMFRKSIERIQFWITSDKNNEYSTWITMSIYVSFLLNSSYNEKYFR
jgi:hypothetical protein